MNIVSSALGHYEPVGEIEAADCVIGHSFGTRTDADSVNRQLAQFILESGAPRPFIADKTLADAFPKGSQQVDEVIEGPRSNAIGGGLGTWGTLKRSQPFMERLGLATPLQVAQANHIGRVAMQARKLKMNSIIPAELPTDFEKKSKQLQTRYLALWVPREVFGSVILIIERKL